MALWWLRSTLTEYKKKKKIDPPQTCFADFCEAHSLDMQPNQVTTSFFSLRNSRSLHWQWKFYFLTRKWNFFFFFYNFMLLLFFLEEHYKHSLSCAWPDQEESSFLSLSANIYVILKARSVDFMPLTHLIQMGHWFSCSSGGRESLQSN